MVSREVAAKILKKYTRTYPAKDPDPADLDKLAPIFLLLDPDSVSPLLLLDLSYTHHGYEKSS
jgi:hypothetical protein